MVIVTLRSLCNSAKSHSQMRSLKPASIAVVLRFWLSKINKSRLMLEWQTFTWSPDKHIFRRFSCNLLK